MPAYIIVQVEVQDPVRYEDYKKMTTGTLAKYRGQFIVRGAKTETLEGEWDPKRLVVLEFPTKELARAWWASEEYAPAKLLRQQTAKTKMILVEGYERTT
ncbi:MAG: DUF1330 domain-containing protein [Bacteroidetes bacterium]|nr:DUF1330 domain-containing protein [Bacteroidota bacterium]MBS1541708.1 DUF1330 domain-containing protein [Bacteroidota bacterium]